MTVAQIVAERDLTYDEIADAVLELVASLVDGHKIAKQLVVPEPDRVRAWCPPEARYDYEGRQTVEATS